VPTNSLPSFCLLLVLFSLSQLCGFSPEFITHATDFCFACCDDVRKGKKLLVAASSTISQQEANYPLPL
jgi:hypothetical protein